MVDDQTPISPPTTPAPTDPQLAVDAALSIPPATPTPTAEVAKPVTEPDLPPLPPLAPPSAPNIPPTPVDVPPPVVPPLPSPSVIVGDETPLAFMGGLPTAGGSESPVSAPAGVAPDIEPVVVAALKKKGSGLKKVGLVVGAIVLMVGVVFGGWQGYLILNGQPTIIAKVSNKQKEAAVANRVANNAQNSGTKTGVSAQKAANQENRQDVQNQNADVKSGTNTAATTTSTTGNSTNFDGNKGSWSRANEGKDPTLPENQASFNTYLENIQSGHPELNPKAPDTCTAAGELYCGDGGGFCLSKGAGKTCIQEAEDRGYTVVKGTLKCVPTNPESVASGGVAYVPDVTVNYSGDGYAAAAAACAAMPADGFGTGMHQCAKGTVGPCTQRNGTEIKSIPSCFCGVVQIDTGTGNTTVEGNCGCGGGGGGGGETTRDVTASTAPTMACTGLAKDKADAAIAVGSVVTLTCAGTVTPTTAGTLSYKFRYNINSGAWNTLANTTATTAQLTIAACGTYSAQCQACATLDRVLQCDPVWQGATQ